LDKDLLASRQLVSESLTINPNYARAYIALANIFYEQRDFAQAFDNYDHATHISDQPYGAHIVEKANLGMGNIFSYQFQSQPANSALAELALQHFETVIDTYQQSKDTSTSELAALAYYGQGVIYQIQNEKDQARRTFEEVLNTSNEPTLKQKAQNRLSQL
jgi:tetratricopeptide (TPR) repeat protein